MRKQLSIGLAALSLTAAATIGMAQIKSMNLEEMVELADDSIHGQIVNHHVFRVDDPIDGPELYFTTLTIEGTSMTSGDLMTVDVTFHGGFISDTEGVYNSEAPSKDDILVGTPVVAFYRWQDNMGGGIAANALSAAHGGLFRTIGGGDVEVVLGKGEGYAVDHNIMITDLSSAVERINKIKSNRQGK